MRDVVTKLWILLNLLRDTFDSWRSEVWAKDLDQQYCCNGDECGCFGASIRDIYTMSSKSTGVNES